MDSLLSTSYRSICTLIAVTVWLVASHAGAQRGVGPGVLPGREPFRVWRVDKPIFEELLGDEPMGLARNGAVHWPHDLPKVEFGLQYGVVQMIEGTYKRWAASRLHPIMASAFVRSAKLRADLKAHGITPVYYIAYLFRSAGRQGEVPLDEQGWPFLLDPKVQARVLAELTRNLEQIRGSIHSVQLFDECLHKVAQQALHFVSKYGDNDGYPFLSQCRQQVKERFGFGTHGMPSHFSENAPFKWIAFRRWLVDEALEFAGQVKALIEEKAPGTPLVSYCGQSRVSPKLLSRWGDVFDIVVAQTRDDGLGPELSPFGCQTKFMVDLCGAEFWPCPHIHNLPLPRPPDFSPEESIELVSQLLRNGATGIDVCTVDAYGRDRKGRKYCFYCDVWGAPGRWHAVVEAAKLMATMNRLRFPEADFAVLYSNDANMARPGRGWSSDAANAYAYAIFGPHLGGWFKFISDDQIARGRVPLSRYKAIVMPYARFQRQTVIEALHAYVENGGTLICADPFVWQAYDNGQSAAPWRDKLFAARPVAGAAYQPKRMVARRSRRIWGRWSGSVPVAGRSVQRLKVRRGANVVARFGDGRAAAVLNRTGRGQALYFAFNPFADVTLRSRSWLRLFRALCEGLGIELGRDIWRFKIPASKLPGTALTLPEGTCLTGNFILWRMSVPYRVRNLEAGGTYMATPAPDAIPDLGPFPVKIGAGKLTNRLLAPQKGNCELGHSELSDWILKWQRSDEISILFDFGERHPVERVNVFYQGQLPATAVWVDSGGGAGWQRVAETNAVARTDGVDMRELTFRPAPARRVRITIGRRTPGATLVLSEVEIWSRGKPPTNAFVRLAEPVSPRGKAR